MTLLVTVMGSTPTGTVTFKDGATILGTAGIFNGAAVFVAAPLAAGAHRLTATYGGDARNRPSTSAPEELIVPAHTTTALTATPSALNATQRLTLTAAVTGGNPNGSVTFQSGSTVLGTANVVNGVAAFVPASLNNGVHILTAAYEGDAWHAPSASSPPVTVEVKPSPSQLSWAPSYLPARIVAGKPLYLRVQVNPVPAVRQGIGGQALDPGAPTMGADGRFGTVTVKDGSAALASAPVLCNQYLRVPNNGGGFDEHTGCWATFPWTVTPAPMAGAHTLTTEYAGNAGYLPSALSARIEVTAPAASATKFSCPDFSVVGTWIDCSVTVTAPSIDPAGMKVDFVTGTVELMEGTAVLGTGTLAPPDCFTPMGSDEDYSAAYTYCPAKVRVTGLAAGRHDLQAGYAGAPGVLPGVSSVSPHTVHGPVATSLRLACPASSMAGQWVDCTATISMSQPSPAPYYMPSVIGQTIQVARGDTVLASGTLARVPGSGLSARIRLTGLAAGVHRLQAQFPGTPSTQPSVSPVLAHTVQPAVTAQ